MLVILVSCEAKAEEGKFQASLGCMPLQGPCLNIKEYVSKKTGDVCQWQNTH